MKTIKQITPSGTMSNLVGMYIIIAIGDKIARTGFVDGKADEYYIIIWHNSLTGETTHGQLFLPSEMRDWYFFKDRSSIDYIVEDYARHDRLRISNYKLS